MIHKIKHPIYILYESYSIVYSYQNNQNDNNNNNNKYENNNNDLPLAFAIGTLRYMPKCHMQLNVPIKINKTSFDYNKNK